MIQESLTDELTDTELLKKCIMSLSDIDIGAIGLALLLRKIPE